MPWKNGLGLTAEIDRHPAQGESYCWRLSQATIQGDSPFSLFPGFDRWLAVWKGPGIILNETKLEPQKPFRFSGDISIQCRLIGEPVIDIGLIFDRSKVDAEMSVVEGSIDLPKLEKFGARYLFDLKSGDTHKFDGALQEVVGRSLLISVSGR